MSVPFKVVARKSPLNSSQKTNYYAQHIITNDLDLDQLSKLMANKMGISYIDCLRVVLMLEETMREELKNGNTIRLGSLGTFSLGISSTGAETPEKVTTKSITSAKINFRPGKKLKEMLKTLEFKKVKG